MPADLKGMRVDQVGSLLRPEKLKESFEKYVQGVIGQRELRQVQDDAIREVIGTQEAHNLPFVTDGEYRRLNFMESFYGVAGFEGLHRWDALVRTDVAPGAPAAPMKGLNPVVIARTPVSQRLRLVRNRILEEYLFASRCTSRPVKITLVNTDRIVETFDPVESKTVYSNVDEFLADIVQIQRRMIEEVVQAGCRYVQIDGPTYTSYVDFGLHMCRGNRQSMWRREGSYNAIAERLFNGLRHHRLLLEYDTERAGTFEPLRFVPKDRTAVLGLITTKSGRLETVDELKRRIDEASRYIPLEQLALSPQCGFASDIRGNLLTVAEQWRKLDVMLETAVQVWGG
ncbi:MAG: Meth synt 2 protein [candidate division NC10 bacterium]|nr:Meth synt 2 protein [candidate division NC10 bacterium]